MKEQRNNKRRKTSGIALNTETREITKKETKERTKKERKKGLMRNIK